MTKTFDFEASNVQTFQQKHVVTYGGNLRFNTFDLSLAPLAREPHRRRRLHPGRDLPVERVSASSRARASTGSTISTAVFSPRVTFMIKPHGESDDPRVVQPRLPIAVGDQQLPRRHHRRADRPVAVRAAQPALNGQIYPLPVRSVGNTDLKETSVDAYEIGYTGVVAKGAPSSRRPFYVNTHRATTFCFTEDPSARYGPANPPPGWPLPPFTLITPVPGERASRRTSRT